TATTILVISASYSQIIELFPTGGGGYLVATRLLGEGPGLVSGAALVVDYALTIAMSVAVGVQALCSLKPRGVHQEAQLVFPLLLLAFSLGGGTYTGIEAVSNGLQILRGPRVKTGRRTMAYMAISLSVTAGGLLLCYLLANVHKVGNETLNATLAKKLCLELF